MNVNNEPVWVDVEAVGEFTKQKYFGKFSIKPYLTNGERADVARLAQMYCRGITDDIDQKTFLTTLAFLKFHIVEADADWWTNGGLDPLDQSPCFAIAVKVRELQDPVKPEEKAAEAEAKPALKKKS